MGDGQWWKNAPVQGFVDNLVTDALPPCSRSPLSKSLPHAAGHAVLLNSIARVPQSPGLCYSKAPPVDGPSLDVAHLPTPLSLKHLLALPAQVHVLYSMAHLCAIVHVNCVLKAAAWWIPDLKLTSIAAIMMLLRRS